MLHLHTRNQTKNTLNRVFMRLGFFVLLLLGISLHTLAQTYVYTTDCAGGTISAADVLAGAVLSSDGTTTLAVGQQSGGTWTDEGGLTFSSNDENAEITGAAANSSYSLEWERNSSQIYNITLITNANTAPTVIFEAGDPTPCGSSYSAQVLFTISGGTSPYNIYITSDCSADYSSSILGSTSIGFGPKSTDCTYTLETFTDANGCSADLTSVADATFTLTSSPTVTYDITGSDVCATSDLSLTLPSSESNITYELRDDSGNVIESWTGDGGSNTFTLTSTDTYYAVGSSYSIWAVDDCGGADLQMNNTYSIVSEPSTQTVSISGSSPYCSGSSYTIGIAGSETGVTYTLYTPSSTQMGSSVSGTGALITFGTNTLTESGTYTVEGTNGTCSVTIGTIDVALQSIPNAVTVSGADDCEPNSLSISIADADAESGVTYYLAESGTKVTSSEISSSPYEWTPSTAGSYTIYAENSCDSSNPVLMSGGPFVLSAAPVTTYNVTGTSACSDVGVTIGLDDTELGVEYYLYDGSSTVGSVLTGTGSAATFTTIYTAGTYSVVALDDCGNYHDMDGGATVTVYASPSSYTLQNVSGNTSITTCSGTSVNLYLSGSETGVSYQVYDSSNNTVGSAVTGTGAAPFNLGVSVSTADTYYVIATNTSYASCTTTFGAMTVSYLTTPTATITDETFNKCEGTSTTFNVTIDITPTNQGPWTLVFSDGSTYTTNTSTFYWTTPNVSTTTTYTVTSITDKNGCTNTTSNSGEATVTVNPNPSVTIDGDDQTCVDGDPITLTANVTPTTVTISDYTWSAGSAYDGYKSITVTPSTQPTHTYSVTVTSSVGCTGSASKDITVSDLPVVSFTTSTGDYEFCEDDAAVTLTGTPTGGTFYVDGTEITSSSFNPSTYGQGSYDVTYYYQDSSTGCENDSTITFTVNPVPNVVLTNVNPIYCADAGVVTFYGSPDGSSAGTYGNFTSNPTITTGYFTDNGDGTASFDVAAALSAQGSATYTFTYTYTNAVGCDATDSETTTLVDDVSTNIDFSGLPSTMCETDAPVTLTAYFTTNSTAVGSGVFTGTGVTDGGDTGVATFDPAVAGNGTHTVTYTYTDANGCTGTVSNSVQIGSTLALDGIATEYCSSDNGSYTLSGTIDGVAAVASDGSTFDVYAPDGSTVVTNQDNGTYDFIPSTLYGNYGGGTYNVVYYYTDSNGCANTLSTDIEIIEELSAVFTINGDDFSTAQANYCVNDATAILMGDASLATATGSVSSVFTGNGVSGNGITGGSFNPQDGSVNYYPTANTISHTVIHTVNGLSCQSPVETFDVYVNPVEVEISGLSASGTYCANDGTSVISVSGLGATSAPGGTAVFYATKNGSSSAFLTDNGNNTATIDPSVGPGTYIITMDFTKTSDGCEVTVVETVVVYADNPVTFSGISDGDLICQSSSEITLRGDMFTGGYGNFVEISPGLSNTGTDDLGNAVADDDGVAILTPGDLAVGTYTITYEFYNANGCYSSESKTIKIVDSPTDTYTVTGGGAYCFDDATPGVTIGLSGSNAGVTYELLYGGASLSPAVTYSTSTGGAFTFDDTGDGTGTDLLFTDEGYYTVQAVLGGCDAIMTGSVLIEQYELVLEIDSSSDVTCNGADDGSVTLKTSGGSGLYEYSDDNGVSWYASSTFNNLTPGDHDFLVMDVDPNGPGCEVATPLTVTISEPSSIVVTEIDNINVGCSGCTSGVDCEGSSTISISGGTPDYATYPGVGYGVVWSTGGTGTTETLMPAGTHSVTVSDGNGCTKNISVIITSNTNVSVVEDATAHVDNVCNGESDGSYTVTANGGSGSYEFSQTDPAGTAVWVPGNVASNQYQVTGLAAGTYNIWVRDASDDPDYSRCYAKISSSIVITEPAALTLVESSQTGISCNGSTDASFIVTASNAESGSYEFSETDPSVSASWTNNSTDSYEVTGVGAGTYTIWVRDAINTSCDYTSVDVTVSDITALSYTLDEQTNVSCHSGNDGRLEVTAAGGSGSYVYQWEYPSGTVISTNKYAENLEEGTYYLTITDAVYTTCTALTGTYIITEPTALTVTNVNVNDADCSGENTGSISVDVEGGTSPYSITWSTGDTDVEVISGLSAGTYTISVVDANGCTYDNTASPYTVSVLNDISLLNAGTITNNDCNGDTEGSIYVQVQGGSGEYEFRLEDSSGNMIQDWSQPVPATSNEYTFNNLAADDYNVWVRDLNNTSCSYLVASYSVTEPVALGLTTYDVSDVSCYGDSNGSITVIASGGSGTYQFNVDNGGYTTGDHVASYTVSGLAAGTHTIWVRDSQATSCEYKLHPTISISQPTILDLSVSSSSEVSCNGNSDGEITVTASGGSGNYDYYINTSDWVSGTGSSYTFTGLSAATYTLQVRDQDDESCTYSITYDLTEPSVFTTSVTSTTNVLCYGESTGVIKLSTSGGVGPFTYSVDGGTTWQSSPLTGLAAGTYDIDVMDEGTGCTLSSAISGGVVITQPTSAISIGAEDITNVTCNGGSDGEIDLQGNVSGGTAATTYSYTWYKKGSPDLIVYVTDDHVTGLEAGTYYVVVTDDNGCSTTSSDYIVSEPDYWEVDFSTSNLSVYDANDGQINVHTVSGSNGSPYTISWSDDASVSSFLRADLAAGTYEFTVSDALGCDTTISNIIITQPDELAVSVVATDVSCYGESDGTIQIEIYSNNGGYYYELTGYETDGGSYDSGEINPAPESDIITGLEPGTYTLNVYDALGSHYFEDGIVIDEPSEVTLTATINDISCYGSADGSIIIALNERSIESTDYITWNGSNGSFLEGDMSSNNSLNVSSEEEFYVVVEDDNGCEYTGTYQVDEPNELVISLDDIDDVTCPGGNDGSIDISVSGRSGGGYTYSWEKKDDSGTYQPYAGNSASLSDLYAGEYQVTVTSITDACEAVMTDIQILDGDEITINVTVYDVTTCVGDDDGSISVSIEGGISPYTVDVTGQSTQTGDGSAAFDFEDLTAGNYVIEVYDARGASCSVTDTTVTITEPSVAFEVTNLAYDIDCDETYSTSGTFSFDVTGGVPLSGEYNYQISLPAASLSYPLAVSVGTTSTQTFSNLDAGTYTLTVSDLNSTDPSVCAFEYEFTLEHIIISGTVDNTTCDGISNGSISDVSIEGTSDNYTYTWTTSDGLGIDNSSLDQSGLSEGTYVLSVTDVDRGCTVTKDFIVEVDNTISVSATVKDVSCYGEEDGAITLTVNGAGTSPVYDWSGPDSYSSSSKNLTDLGAGLYAVEITAVFDGVSCVSDASYSVTQPNAISYTAGYEITSCDPYERTLVLDNVSGGTGDYTYIWVGPDFDPEVPADPTNVVIYEGGSYKVTVKDENQCAESRTISVPYEITIDPDVSDVTCNGGDNGSILLNLSGGSGSYSFSWTGPSSFTSTSRTIDNLYAGTYTVTITDTNEDDGSGNCSRTFSIDVDEPSAIVIDTTVEDVTCYGGSTGQIELEVSGGTAPYSYSWSPVEGSNLATDKNQYDLPAGVYAVTVTDDNGCTGYTSVTVFEDDEIVLSSTVTETICAGTDGEIDLTVTGGSGSGFSYSWSSSDGSGLVQGAEDQTGLTGGTYTVVVSDLGDGRSCSATLTDTLTDAIEISNEVVNNVSCSGNDDGSISYDVTGGDGNYTYTWSVISGDESAIVAGAKNQSGLSEGVYQVVITDGRTDDTGDDCSINETFTVVASTGLSVNVSTWDSDICFGEPGGSLKAYVTGGSGDYSYYWNGVLSTDSIGDLVQGIYGLEVVDNVLGCTFMQSYEIEGPDEALSIDTIEVTDVLCYDENTGAINVTVSGGTEPSTGYIYTWTSGTSAAYGSNPTNLFAGTYNLTVTDDHGCTVQSGDIVISQPASHIVVDNPQVTDVSVVSGSDGEIQVDVYDGVAPRSVEWFDASGSSVGTTNPITGLSAGTYSVVATDANGCSDTYTNIKVVEPGENLGFEKTVYHISPCNGADNGEIHINRVYGGYPLNDDNYRIEITGSGVNVDTYATSYSLTGLSAGWYKVKVTDDVPVYYEEDIEITEYDALSLTTTNISDVDCYDEATGEIQVSVSGGSPDASGYYLVEISSDEGYYSYNESVQANVAFSFTNLPAGNYTITLTDHAEDFDNMSPDRGNCETSNYILISEPSAEVELTSVSGDQEICEGDSYDLSINTTDWDFTSDGNLVVAVYDDFTTTEYTVDESPYIISVSPASSRTYKITKVYTPGDATCLRGETTGDQVSVIVNDLPTANIYGPTEVCEDGSVTLTVSFTGQAPYSFTWRDQNNGTSGTISNITASSYSFSDTPVADASYIVDNVSDDNGCSGEGNGEVDVTINNKPIITLSGSTNICAGESTDLTLTFNEDMSPYTIVYEANGVEGTLLVTPTSSLTYTWTVSPTTTTVYSITSVVDEKGCEMDISASIQATVTVNQLPAALDTIDSTLDTGEVCQGATGIDYSIDAVSYATSYVWSVESGMNIITGNGTTDVTINFDDDFTGGYISVYAKNDCGVSSTIERWVNVKALPDEIIDAPTGDTELCEGETGIIYSIDAVDNASYYEWSLPTGFILQGDGTGTSIVVDLDPDVPSTTGVIYVRAINDCSTDEVWSPGLTVTITPLPVADAGEDNQVCQTTYVMDAAPLSTGETGLWTILGGSAQFVSSSTDKTSVNADIYNLSQGDNTFVWTVTNTTTGCYSSDTVVISNNQVTVKAVASDDEVCDGSVELTGTSLSSVDDADQGFWTTTGNANISDANSNYTTVTDMDKGENSFTWTIRKGSCYSEATVTVTNDEPSTPVIYDEDDVAISLQDLTCQTNYTTLRGSSVSSDEMGYWLVESGSVTIDDRYSETINVTNITEGDHILSWNILRGDCLLSTTVTIRNNALEVSAGVDKYTCDGTTVLYGTAIPSDASGQWTVVEGAGNFVDGADVATTEVTDLDQSTTDGRNLFVWTLTRNGCASSDTVIVYNDQPSDAEISGGSSSVSICDYDYSLYAVTPVYGAGVWTLVDGQASIEDPGDANTAVSNLGEGDNVFRWTVSNNTCSSSVDFTITNLHVETYAGADTAVCSSVASLNATEAPDGTTGEWTTASGSGGAIFNPSSSSASTTATSLSYGTNSLVWTITQDGCVSSDTVVISNNAPYEVEASTYIYTDGDEATLRATTPTVGTGVWSLTEGRGNIEDPYSSTTDVTDLMANYNYFRWTVTNLACSDYVDVVVQSGELDDADAGTDQELCDNYTTLSANEPEGTYGEWTIDEGSGVFSDSNSATTEVTNIGSGTNVYRWTLRFAGGGENYTTDSVVIINNKPTDAYAGIDISVCDDYTTLNAQIPVIGSPTWSVLSGGGIFADNTDPDTDVTDLAKGENIFKYTVQEEDCFSYDTIYVYNYEPSDAYAGEDLVVCQDSAALNPDIPTYGTGSWRVIEGSGKGKDDNGNETDEIGTGYVYSLAQGINKLVWEVQVDGATSSCISRDTITIENYAPTESFAGQDRNICTDSVNLSASTAVYGDGTWTLISGSGTIADSSLTNTLVTNLSTGSNVFRWTVNNNGCTSYSDVEISNNLIEALAGVDQVNCADTAYLEANNASPGEGTWGVQGGSGSANFDDTSDPYTTVRNLDHGENILTWTINYEGCQSVSEISVTNNKPSDADAGDNKDTCEDSAILSASSPEVGTGLWTIVSGGGTFEDDTDPSSTVDNLKFGSNIYRWTVTNEDCTSYDDVEISYNFIEATVGDDQEICADNTFLNGNNASPGVGTWSVVGGAGAAYFADSNDATTEVYDLSKGSNVLMWTIEYEGCTSSVEVTITNNTPSTAYAGNTQELCTDATTLDATSVAIGTGAWSVLTGSATIASDQINEPKAEITGLSKGDNVLRWTVTSDNGLCTSTDEVTISNDEPSDPYAGADEEYCSSTVVLKASEPDYGTGAWSIIEGGGNFDDTALAEATITNLNEGQNILRWTVTEGQCSKYDEIIILNNEPTTADAGPDIEDCKDYAELDANEPTQGDGYWTLVSGNATFVDSTDAYTTVQDLTFGENILMWNIVKGNCSSTDEISVFNQVPDQAEAGTDRETCDDYLTLNANDPDSGDGVWTVISGSGEFVDSTNPTTIVKSLGFGENQFKWTVSYGECSTEDVVEVVSNKADPDAGEDDITYESSYALKASNPGDDIEATWSVIGGTGDFEDDTYFNTTVSNLTEGVNTFRWTMEVNDCVTYDEVSIEYRVVPDAMFVTDTTQGCYPLTVEFTNYSENGTEYLWDFGDGETSTERNPVHTFEDPGTYTVILTAPGPDDVNGEYQTDITVYDHPTADFSYSPDEVYVPGDVLRCYSLSVDALTYYWEFGDGGTSTDVNPSHTYVEEGVYDLSLSVESKYGCVDEIIKEDAVTAYMEGFVVFPNSFMPRPDGGTSATVGGGESNTVFRPVYQDVDTYTLQIFNRWGQLIYQSNDIDEGWNGFYNGVLAQQAVYVYKATGTFVSGTVFNKTGSVLLVR